MQYYLGRSIAPGTQRTYDTAVANWRAYSESRSWDPDDPVTSLRAEEWLAGLADQGRLKASTIRTYKAGLSTWHELNSTAANPLQSSRITRLITGIEAAAAEREAASRKAKSSGVTMEMVRLLEARYAQGSARELMMVGAIALATAAALRPSELLGGAREARARALTPDQLRFFDGTGRPLSHLNDRGVIPDYCTVTLRISKTNQRGREEPIHVSSVSAVRAIWAWRRARQDGDGELFKLPDARPLRITALLGFARQALRELGQGDLHLTGKCFRIGGASTLAALGADDQDLRKLGRWRTNMWTTYADAESQKKRDVKIRREM